MGHEEFYMARKVSDGRTAGVHSDSLNVEFRRLGSDDLGVYKDVHSEGIMQCLAGKAGRDVRRNIRPEKGV